jgi:hypothetical protein
MFAKRGTYQRSIIPIFAGPSQRPKHVGTGFLIRVESHIFLVSAAHILNSSNLGSRRIQIGAQLTSLGGILWSTLGDRYDVSALLLATALVTLVDPLAGFPSALMRLNIATGPEYLFTFCGYTGKNPNALTIYTANGLERSKYTQIGASHMTHVGVDLCSKAKDEHGRRVSLGFQKGLSGGPILAQTDGSGPLSFPRLRIVGVVIERSYQYLLGTQIRIVYNAILDLVPSLKGQLRVSNEPILPAKRYADLIGPKIIVTG